MEPIYDSNYKYDRDQFPWLILAYEMATGKERIAGRAVTYMGAWQVIRDHVPDLIPEVVRKHTVFYVEHRSLKEDTIREDKLGLNRRGDKV